MRRALNGFLVSMALAGSVMAGTFSSGLERFVAGKPDNESITVLLAMQDQADIASLDQELHARQATLAERHELVVGALMNTATRSQANLLTQLGDLKAEGKVNGFTPYWLVNAVIVNAPISVLRTLAARGDVEVAEPNLVVDMIKPIMPDKPNYRGPLSNDRVAEPGVIAVRAPEVWSTLGITGVGALVGGIDTGVEDSHVALSSRWRGNNGHPLSECWLDAANLGHPTPTDTHGHGTHTMGTMVGGAPGLEIGVSPGSQWIASNIINSGTGSTFDNGVIASFQFMADPDGNPGTIDDVPDVVQNSWGVNEGFTGYFDCDSRWWVAIDNCEAAGVCVTWSAGNEGPGGTSLRSPADRALTPYNCFSVGATSAFSPYDIASFSSRGPSGCGGAFAMKPEVSAPGVDTYSATPSGGYTTMSGTSMAGPHVAGVVALMRSANPNVDVSTIKQILMDTSIDKGTVGEDNTYGHGFIDAYEAVLAVMSGYGTLAGTVTNSSNGNPIAGALVQNTAGPHQANTNGSGVYSLMMPAGTYTMGYSAFGFTPQNAGVTISEDLTTTQNVALSPAPSALLYGYVYGPDANPVVGATIDFTNAPIANATTGAGGYYSASIPLNYTYNISAYAPGMGGQSHTVAFNASQQLDFNLPLAEGFESGNFSSFNWTHGGTAPWTVVNDVYYTGTHSAKSGLISHSQTSSLSLAMMVPSASSISFYYRVSSESNYDYLRFYIDGVQQNAWSGEIGWTQATYAVAAGNRTFTWTYSKDGSVNTGSDCAWIDDVVPPAAVYPNVAVNPLSASATVPPGGTDTDLINISNTGEGDLNWSASVTTFTAATDVPYMEVAKGQVDPRVGSAARAAGGPDAFGYSWKDSNEPGGPAFNWFDISGIGTVVGNTDDTNYGPYNLGFTFSYYGVDFTNVRVCTNGWLSFTSTSNALTNQGMPDSADPNNLLAAFWDDLNPAAGGSLKYYADGANQRFIVQWTGVPIYGSSNYQTFQVIINADGRIVYQYQTVTAPTTCTVGIEDGAGTDGLQVAFNAPYLTNNLAIEFSAVVIIPWLSVAPTSGTVVPGGGGSFVVNYNATEIAFGTFTGQVNFSCNDPDTPSITIPVTMIVSGVDTVPPVITHTALANTENTVGPYLVSALVNDPSGLQSVTLSYRLNGVGSWINVAMTGGPTFIGNIPGQPFVTTVDYYITAVDNSANHNSAQTGIYTFQVVDNSMPQIVHTPLTNTQDVTGPYVVNATITDNTSVTATLAYRSNGGAWTNVGMTGGPAFTAPIPGRPIGTVIDYTITAVDGSPAHNTIVSPTYTFTILAPTGLEYCQDFETGTLDDFTEENYSAGNTWTTSSYTDQGFTAYISYSSTNQEDHAALISPVFDCSGQATVDFSFWMSLHFGYSSYWTDAYVRGSTDGGATWPIMIAEWHATPADPDVYVTGDFQYDITSWAAGQSNVKVMFEYHDLYDWDWFVDDVCVTGTLNVNPLNPVDLNIAYLGAGSAQLSWTAVPQATSYDVYVADDMDGPFTFVANTAGTNYALSVASPQTKCFRVVTRNDAPLSRSTHVNPVPRLATEAELLITK